MQSTLATDEIDFEKYVGNQRSKSREDEDENVTDGLNPAVVDIGLSKKAKKETIKLGTIAEGNTFGEDDAVLGRKHFGTMRCISGEGMVHCIKTHEFLRKFQEIKPSWRTVMEQVV